MTSDAVPPATRFVPVPDLDALNDLIPRSGLVVLFLHVLRCGISVRVYDEVARLGGAVALVDVSRHHHVKWAIEDRTGVRHASPQVIVLHHGRAVWSASHFAITADAVRRACRAAGGERSPQG